MIDYIKYTVDGRTYELINNSDGTWSRALNAPNIIGRYDLLLEIGQGGIVTYIDSKDPRYSLYLDVIKQIDKNVDLIKYLPVFLRESKVFNEIFDSENIELDIAYDLINTANLDIFIRLASNERITRLEGFLGIKGLGSLEQRKSYLLTMFQRGKKLNEVVIKEVVNTIAGSDCIVTFFGADELDNPHPGYGLLQVEVLTPSNEIDYRYSDISRVLKPLAPAHIKLLVIRFFATWDDMSSNFADWSTVVTNVADWQAVKDYIPPQE